LPQLFAAIRIWAFRGTAACAVTHLIGAGVFIGGTEAGGTSGEIGVDTAATRLTGIHIAVIQGADVIVIAVDTLTQPTSIDNVCVVINGRWTCGLNAILIKADALGVCGAKIAIIAGSIFLKLVDAIAADTACAGSRDGPALRKRREFRDAAAVFARTRIGTRTLMSIIIATLIFTCGFIGTVLAHLRFFAASAKKCDVESGVTIWTHTTAWLATVANTGGA